MRIISSALATPFILLVACGGPQTSQVNNSQANISKDSRTADNASGSNLQQRVSLGDVAKVMHERHEGMEKIGKSAKAINRELTGAAPDHGVVKSSAQQIAVLSKQASSWFLEGTGPEAGKTGAKAAIWQNRPDFAVKLHNFQVAAAKFDTIATTGDAVQIKASFADLAGTCKACHDKYRSEMHH